MIQHAELRDAAEILALQKIAYRSEAAIYDDDAIPPLTQTLAEMEADLQNNRNLYLYRKLGYRAFRRQAITDALTLVFLEKNGPGS